MSRRSIMTAILVVAMLAASMLSTAGVVADSGVEPLYHRVRWGETLSSIAWRYGVTVQEIVEANNLRSANLIYAGQRLLIPRAPVTCIDHIVQRGETLYSIAARYGVSVWEIARLNGIWNINLIFIGQRLCIPTDVVPVPPDDPPPPDEMPRVQEEIVITSPSLNDEVSSPVTITGWGRGFENTLAVDVLDENGVVIAQGFVMIDADLGQIGPFTGTIEFTAPATTQPGRISVYAVSPRDGAIEHLNSVSVTLVAAP